jgi:serine/threonine-protein phosphatase PPG1
MLRLVIRRLVMRRLRPPSLTSPAPASVDLDECISRLYKKELLAESVIEAICAKTKELLMRESNVVHVRAPVTVVGDIHGQFYDLIEIFKIGGWCPDTNYLFLGRWLPTFLETQGADRGGRLGGR